MQIRNPSEDLVKDIFSDYGSVDPRYYWALQELFQEGILSLHEDAYTGGDIQKTWVDKHIRPGNVDSAENREHFKLKIIGARFLDRRGHDMETEPVSDAESGKLFRYTGFEKSYPGLNADVACDDSCCDTVLEAGFTPPDRVLRMFGFTIAGDLSDMKENDQPTKLSVRHQSRSLKALHVLPYSGSEVGRNTVYSVKPESLPECNASHIAEIVDDVLNGQ